MTRLGQIWDVLFRENDPVLVEVLFRNPIQKCLRLYSVRTPEPLKMPLSHLVILVG